MSSRQRLVLRRGASLCVIVHGKRIKLKLQALSGVAELEQLTDLPPGVSIMVLRPSRQRFRRRKRTRIHRPLMTR